MCLSYLWNYIFRINSKSEKSWVRGYSICHSARYCQVPFYKPCYQLAFPPMMYESACLLKASPTCVVKLLNFRQLDRWEMVFQHSLICIKISHMFPEHVIGLFPTTPIDWIRIDLPPVRCWELWFPITPRGQWGLRRVTAPQSPSWVSECHWPPPPPTSWGSNGFLHTKKTLSEEDDLASEKCWTLDLLHSSDGQLGLRDDGAKSTGCGRLGEMLLEEVGIWRHRVPRLSRMTDSSSRLPLSFKACQLYPLIPGCLTSPPKT